MAGLYSRVSSLLSSVHLVCLDPLELEEKGELAWYRCAGKAALLNSCWDLLAVGSAVWASQEAQ